MHRTVFSWALVLLAAGASRESGVRPVSEPAFDHLIDPVLIICSDAAPPSRAQHEREQQQRVPERNHAEASC